MKVRYSYLNQQFEECDDLWQDLRTFVATGDFTLGAALEAFENRFAQLIGVKYAVGVNSGTDAIKLSLRSVGVGYGDEVITSANTFVATVGAISELGAVPVFIDCDDTFCMDVDQVESAITSKTKAIVPVHYAGVSCEMDTIQDIARNYGLLVIEDAAQGIMSAYKGRTHSGIERCK